MGRPFCENVLILVKCPGDSRKKSDWFRCKEIPQTLKYLNFKCEQSEIYFFLLICPFHHSAHVPCQKIRWRLAKSVSGNQAPGRNLLVPSVFGRLFTVFVGLEILFFWYCLPKTLMILQGFTSDCFLSDNLA